MFITSYNSACIKMYFEPNDRKGILGVEYMSFSRVTHVHFLIFVFIIISRVFGMRNHKNYECMQNIVRITCY
jgi:hypothetical protein